tara:strand:+ start:34 stop:897 length:864 start_codon:yes stop_codon:yes gene_type:complete
MNYKNNTHCYNFKSIQYKNALLNSIDATYIIHLEGNGRLQHIESQLEKYHPSNQVYIVFNKGYKKCEKILKKQATTFDLKDAYLNVFQHSIDNNHKTILILEDDFIFNTDIKTENRYVDEFIIQNREKPFVYYLGCLPVLNVPVSIRHQRMFWGLTTHACIYTSNVKQILIDNADSVDDWDIYLNIQFHVSRYRYINPLCYQTFPRTENRDNWKNAIYFGEYLIYLLYPIFSLLNLYNEPEPGFTIAYIFSYILTAFLFIIIIITLYKLYCFVKTIRFSKILQKINL